MRRATLLLASILISVTAFAQEKAEFEVASIKPSPDQFDRAAMGQHIDGSQVRYSYLSLKDYIRLAYRVKLYQVTGPAWIEGQRFEIAAKLPDGAKMAQIPDMLQTLLVDRFGLKFHHESKEFPVYSLEIAKGGLKIEPTDPNPMVSEDTPVNIAASGSENGVSINLGGGSAYSFANNKLEAKKLTMARFVDILGRFMDRPVIDSTNLTGGYDFTLEVTPEDYTAMLIRSALSAGVTLPPQALRVLDFASGDSLVSALQKVGLVLVPKKAPLDVLVVDSIQKSPTN